MNPELWQALLGPVGALALAMAGIYRLWSELQTAKASHEKERAALLEKLELEQDARLADARETTTALLDMQARVILAVEAFEQRPCLAETTGPLSPPRTPNESLVPTFARKRQPSSPG